MTNFISKETIDFLKQELVNIKKSIEFSLENQQMYLDKTKKNLDELTEEYTTRLKEKNNDLEYIEKLDSMIIELELTIKN
jgi:flagellar motility protein MotE (MotC chaperone)